MATKSGTATLYPASVDTTRAKYASVNSSYPLTNPIGKSSSNTTYAQWNLTTGSNAESYVYYKFDTDAIPAEATITKVACTAKAYVNQTNSSRINTRQIQLFATNTAKGSASTISTSTSAISMTCGTWTRTELIGCYIRIYVKRGTSSTTSNYYARFYGATLTVDYTYEDVQYTVSTSIVGNGAIDPSGTALVSKGESFSMKIHPASDKDTILVTDNGRIVSDSLTDMPAGAQYEVVTKSGASYGFQQNYDANCRSGWWQSTNKAKASSASVSTVRFTVTKTTKVTVRCICYAESTYDYFLVGPMDGSLSTSASADSGAVFTTQNSNSQNEQTYVFNNVAAGTHSFDVKYFKDSYTDSNWDSAQFIVEMEPSNSVAGGKVYTIDNVQENHNIIVTIIASASGTGVLLRTASGWVEASAVYIKRNGSWQQCTKDDIEGLKYKKQS